MAPNDTFYPKYLYKYYPQENWNFIAIDWTIRFTPVKELNDCFECMPVSDNILSTKSKEKLLTEDKIDCSYPSVADHINEKFYSIINRYGVLSLTESSDNILMWAHYASAHKGFVIEFDTEKLNALKRKDSKDISIHKVEYSSMRNKVFKDGERRTPISFLGKKDIQWSYEKEWRGIVDIITQNIEINGKKGVCEICKSSISSIIFGANMPDDMIKKHCQDIYQQEGCENIAFKKAKLHQKEYGIVIEEIATSLYK
ncbi:DUF2971 domain-containing protein [Bilophila wadsworthia]|uniref:DUF2971 domain-containing protein n=1 Tax=Bilophila wadsworthia TaxID=35833 RepID=UPI001D25D1CC|nr:DUF2971 domain-containing protein [Bilophila wadsworthia]MBS5374930.1 DUF2971 domain-containing protein [Bilophila wadsworthia]